MVSKVFAIYDSKVQSYMRPFLMVTAGQALRGFQDIVDDNGTEIGKHPEDFTLFELGEYDDQTGKYKNLPTPHPLAVAHEIKKQQWQPEHPEHSKIKPIAAERSAH